MALKFHAMLLRNWKNFAAVELAIRDRLFLVGPNASGKSNLLDAFRFLRDIASTGGGFQEAVAKRGGVSAIRCLAARRDPKVTIQATVQDAPGAASWEYRLEFHQDNRRRPLISQERVCFGTQVHLQRPNEEDKKDPERLTQTYLEQVNVNQPFRVLSSYFASIRYLHIVPQLVREPDRSIGRTGDPYGGDFLEQVAKTSEKKRQARLRRIVAALEVAVPQLEAIELWRDDRGTPHLRGKYKHWRPQGAWQTEGQFSDGTLRLLGLLWAMMEAEGPLLLEEPELSLHPQIVRVLPQMLARVQRKTGRQIFLSTHSPDLLRDDGIGLDEVFMLVPGAEGTEVRPASSTPDAVHLLESGQSLADIVIPQTSPAQTEQLPLFADLS